MTHRLPIAAALMAALLAGCSTASRLQSSHGNKYRYSYRLVSPSSGGRMSFQDERIRILFLIDESAIRFKLQNKSDAPMKVVWEQSSLGVRNRYYAVRNTRTLYLPSYRDNAVPAIMPGGYVIDLAIPAENISYTGDKWREKDLLPTTDRNSPEMGNRILANRGSIVNLILPIQVGENVWNYSFRFEVTAVNVLPWERYRYPRRPAPPPIRSAMPSAGTTDQIITAVVVAAVVGIAAIFLTQKKSPPSE